MRTDQYDRLKKLQVKLTDVVLSEAGNITALEPTIARQRKNDKYSTQERKLHWRKKNTMATLGILTRIQQLVNNVERGAKMPGNQVSGNRALPQTISTVIEEAEAEVRRRATLVEPPNV